MSLIDTLVIILFSLIGYVIDSVAEALSKREALKIPHPGGMGCGRKGGTRSPDVEREDDSLLQRREVA